MTDLAERSIEPQISIDLRRYHSLVEKKARFVA